mmetsp:Transcript_26345/g.40804  ORF Transcript_26345/g.40804 Transcript_26345/m.40804 type:complete len:159 (-) Transcript_26345:48-524(-)
MSRRNRGTDQSEGDVAECDTIIPHLPVHVICGYHETAAEIFPNIIRQEQQDWQRSIRPRHRWRVFRAVKAILVDSMPPSYAQRNDDHLTEVSHLVERTFFGTCFSRDEYFEGVNDAENENMLRRRIFKAVWFHARHIVRVNQEARRYFENLQERRGLQ